MHRLIFLAVTAGSLTLACAPPAADRSEPPARDAAQQVLAAEDEYVAAELSRDEAALRRLVDDAFVFNGSGGTTSGKEQLIQSVLGMNMAGQTITERSVLVEGNVAIIFGTTELRLGSPGPDERISLLRYTSAFVNRGGEWRRVALHMSPRAPRQP